MHGKMTIVRVDGTREIVELTAPPELDILHAAVGGYIETVPYFSTFEGAACIAFCNEEGKLEGLPVNLPAHVLWETAVGQRITSDVLVGPIAIITGDDALLRAL